MSQPSPKDPEKDLIAFSAQTPSFHLRADFPQELGYLELLHQSVDAGKVMGFFDCLLQRPIQRHVMQAVLDIFETCPPPRYFAYHGILTPSLPNQLCCWLTDGKIRMFVPHEGLWSDMLGRFAVATNLPLAEAEAQIQPPVFDDLPLDPKDQWAFPKDVILHDTLHSRAGFVPRAYARAYLAYNYYQS